MDARLVVLKLFLDKLDVRDSIDSFDDRKRVQKAVYLGQVSGVDLGYRFGWYLKGPYSPALARDYYALAESIASGDTEYENKELRDSLQKKLEKARPVLVVPHSVRLPQEDWLELLASLDYLIRVRRLDRAASISILETTKPRLVRYVENAEKVLRETDLLPVGR